MYQVRPNVMRLTRGGRCQLLRISCSATRPPSGAAAVGLLLRITDEGYLRCVAEPARTQRRNELLHFPVLHGTIPRIAAPDVRISEIVFDLTEYVFERPGRASDRMMRSKFVGAERTIEHALEIVRKLFERSWHVHNFLTA
jgi:hypothetical protein